MINVVSIARNAMLAFASQGISLLVSITMSLIVPKILGVEEFGYWQLFIFYTNYAGIFHLGLNDGVYLREGGNTRSALRKSSVGGQFRFAIALQLLFGSLISVAAALSASDQNRSFVLFTFSLYLIATNLTSFLGFVFQAVNETRLFSLSIVIDRIAFLIPLLFLTFYQVAYFQLYAIFYLVAKLVSLIWCVWEARDILFMEQDGLSAGIRESINSIRIGFKLMIANLADMLILGAARALVDVAWGIETFGRVSFTLSLVNFFILFVTQLSMVLFPALRQIGVEERRSIYLWMRDAFDLVLPSIYILFYPISWLIASWLPQYGDSIRWLAILLPVCVYNTKMDICCTTFYKVLRMEADLLRLNLVAVFASLLGSLVGIELLQSIDAVLFFVTFCIGLRSLFAGARLDGELSVESGSGALAGILLSGLFSVATLNMAPIAALLLFSVFYGGYLWINRLRLRSIVSSVRIRI